MKLESVSRLGSQLIAWYSVSKAIFSTCVWGSWAPNELSVSQRRILVKVDHGQYTIVALAVVASVASAADINVINDTKASIRKYLYTTVLRIKDVSSNLVVGALIAPKYVLITPSTDVERMKLVKQTKYPKSKPSTYEFGFAHTRVGNRK
ncbi:hypothetical protein B5M09_010580 [Aphanomyces astaci]|uniref:Uncharacterized protein n=1 Tax=Aphanomyces astaci TaxID=112090 RepID=A0A3R7WPP9_APHAT|nr:hypothetical protein B5M09_010580 [Aphanomyces astaci]